MTKYICNIKINSIDIELISRIYTIAFSDQQQKEQIPMLMPPKWIKQFTEEDLLKTNRHNRRGSMLLVVQEMQVKTIEILFY